GPSPRMIAPSMRKTGVSRVKSPPFRRLKEARYSRIRPRLHPLPRRAKAAPSRATVVVPSALAGVCGMVPPDAEPKPAAFPSPGAADSVAMTGAGFMPFYEHVFIARQDISPAQVEALTETLQ